MTCATLRKLSDYVGKVPVLLAVCAASFAAFAADPAATAFPDADGKGDLASPASWGTDQIPAATERIAFKSAYMTGPKTVTATKDVTFNGLLFNLGSAANALTFDMTDAATGATGARRKITLTDAATISESADNNKVTFKGGDWTGTSFTLGKWYKQGNVFRFEDAHINISGNFVGVSGGPGNDRMIFDNGCIVTAGTFCVQVDQGANTEFHVLGGSKVTLTGTDSQIYTGQSSGSNNGVWVSGEGSVLDISGTTSGTCLIGSAATGSGHFLKIDDHATANIQPKIEIARANGGTNWISVADGGVLTARQIQVGTYQGNLSWGNYLLVGEDGTLNVSSLLRLGSIDGSGTTLSPGGNAFIVSNGTYRGVFPSFGSKPGCSNMLIRVVGRKSVFAAGLRPNETSLSMFAHQPHNRIEFDNAVWTNNEAKTIYVNTTQGAKGQCSFALMNSAEFYTTNAFNVSGNSYAALSNLVSVTSGSRFHAGSVGTWSKFNVFSVSNGTFEVEKDMSVTSSGGNVSSQGGISNNWFKIAGDSPKVRVENGTFTIDRASFLSYDIPAGGYAPDLVPVKAKAFKVNDAASLVCVNGVEARQSALRRAGVATEVVTLVESVNDISFNATALAASQALLPEKSSLTVSADKKKLLLAMKSGLGLMMIVR